MSLFDDEEQIKEKETTAFNAKSDLIVAIIVGALILIIGRLMLTAAGLGGAIPMVILSLVAFGAFQGIRKHSR